MFCLAPSREIAAASLFLDGGEEKGETPRSRRRHEGHKAGLNRGAAEDAQLEVLAREARRNPSSSSKPCLLRVSLLAGTRRTDQTFMARSAPKFLLVAFVSLCALCGSPS